MSPATLQMSMGMERRWHAKIVFMIGMYWWARSPDTERMRMRGRRVVGRVDCEVLLLLLLPVGSAAAVAGFGNVTLVAAAWLICSRLMCVNARVRAPAMEVVGVRLEGGVVL